MILKLLKFCLRYHYNSHYTNSYERALSTLKGFFHFIHLNPFFFFSSLLLYGTGRYGHKN